MPTQALLDHGRQAAERLMTDTCTIERPTGEFATNPDTGVDEPVMETVYPLGGQDGRCKLGSTPSTGEHFDTGEHRYLVEQPRLHLPYSVNVRSGDQATITSTETGNVSTNIPLRLMDLNRGTHKTSQRWNVEVITG